MNIIICDDRIDDRKNLSDLLSDYGEKKNYEFAITEYDSGEQLCEEQSALEACQILFLDINMQGMDGLKTAMRIKEKYPKLPVVLVTAYMNYALDGYKVKASRFLLKDNLADTIEECMDDLIAEINKNRRILEFRFVEGTIKLYADDIIYIETELHKNVFYTEKGTFQIYKKLDELENEFKDMGFVRAHLSFLVNELNQIGIKKICMGRSTDFLLPLPVFRQFADDWYAADIPVPFHAFPRPWGCPQSRHRNSRHQSPASVFRLSLPVHGLRFYPQRR